LEALPDPSLPHGGPGRSPDSGNFHLNEWRVFSAGRPCALTGILVEYGEVPQYPLVIDGKIDERMGWSNYPRSGKANFAVVSTSLKRDSHDDLKVELYFSRAQWLQHNLGRFRLSITGDPTTLDWEQKRLAASKLTDPWLRLAAAYQIEGDQRAIDQLVARRPTLAGPIGDLFAEGKDWRRAIALYSQGITEKTTDVDLHSKRARTHEALQSWDAAAADWERAATGNPDGAKLLAEFARRLAAAGQVPLAKSQYEKAQALYERLLEADPESDLVAAELAQLLLDGGRTREAIPVLAMVSAANPKDILLSMKLAALQAWFGQEQELAATRQRVLAFAKGTNQAPAAEPAAKACSILPYNDNAELDAALALARKGAELGKSGEWNLLTLGMAEYRRGNDAAAAEALLAAANAGSGNGMVKGIAAFYRAMSLFRQEKPNEARKLAIEAAAQMRPLPTDEQNPLPDNASPWDDLILWLAYKEAKAMIRFDAPPATPVQTKAK
jgi:hypothetical protein